MRTNPGLQVPVGSRFTSSRRHTTSTWSLGGLSAVRRAVTRIASAYSPYEMTGTFFVRVTVSPSRATAHSSPRDAPSHPDRRGRHSSAARSWVTPRDALHTPAAGRRIYTTRTSLACKTSRKSPRLSPAGRGSARGDPGLATATRRIDPGSAHERRKAPTGWSGPFGGCSYADVRTGSLSLSGSSFAADSFSAAGTGTVSCA